MQRILGNEIPLDKTNFFTEFNHPGILLEHKEQSETIYLAINTLPDSQKTVFTLAKLDGKTYQEIAEITGKSMSSVESIMFRAKKNLQKKFWLLYEKNLEKSNAKHLHGKLFGLHSSSFLKANDYFLE